MENIILKKSYDFAIRIVNTYKVISVDKKEFTLSRQLLRSGTSIGANVEEGVGGFTKKDFRAKMSIAYKEAREASYWLRLLKDTSYLNQNEFDELHPQCEELKKIMFKIVKNSA